MGIEIRPAEPDDATAVCAVLRRSITECCTEDHRNCPEVLSSWLGNKTPQIVASWFATSSNYTLVAVHDGAVVGVALLTQAGKVSLCYVLPEMMHRGVGKSLMGGLEQQAHAWGIGVLKLKSTAAARDFFARNGYINGGKDKSCFGIESDFFWKNLDEAANDTAADARKRYCGCNTQ